MTHKDEESVAWLAERARDWMSGSFLFHGLKNAEEQVSGLSSGNVAGAL
jgi:hypothetical protein